jgi:hypothetical protein
MRARIFDQGEKDAMSGETASGRDGDTPAARFNRVRDGFDDVAPTKPLTIFSVPKCGTMLLRNIMYMFWPKDRWHEPFVENWTLNEAFARARTENIICTGHLDFSLETCKFSRGFKRLVLIRDPAAYAISYARFMLSTQFRDHSRIGRKFRDDNVTLAETIRFAIIGLFYEDEILPNVLQQYAQKAMAWASPDSLVVRFEELQSAAVDPARAENLAYFKKMFEYLELPVPSDFIQRIEAGASRSLSSTVPENLTFDGNFTSRVTLAPEELHLLETVAPGLRRALSYCR